LGDKQFVIQGWLITAKRGGGGKKFASGGTFFSVGGISAQHSIVVRSMYCAGIASRGKNRLIFESIIQN